MIVRLWGYFFKALIKLVISVQKIYSREEWDAREPCSIIDELENPQNRSIICQTGSPWMCHDFVSFNVM